MRKISALLILPVCVLLLSAVPVPHTINTQSNDDPLVIRFRPNTPKANEAITFSINDYESGRTFHWDFGDGTEEVIATKTTCTHSFSKPGTYRVKVHSNGGSAAYEMVMIAE